MGDLNVDLLKEVNNSHKLSFLMQDYHFTQVICGATRVTNHSSTLIDHAYVTRLDYVRETLIAQTAASDHFPIGLTYGSENLRCIPKNSHTEISMRSLRHFDPNDFLYDLESKIANCQDNIVSFNSAFNETINKHAPQVVKRVKHAKQPDWFTNEIPRLMRQRSQFYD